MFKPLITPRDLAERYNRWMPEHVRQYLKGRGIHAPFIDRHKLGWDGKRITIPVFGPSVHEVLGFRYATLPEDSSAAAGVVSEERVKGELYGRETLARTPHRLVICEDEFDRLVLESRNFRAVAIGDGDFLPEWAAWFEDIQDVFVCFHRGRRGDAAAQRIGEFLPQARIARLPSDVGDGGSVTDFFVKLLRTEREFELVLAAAAGSNDDADIPPNVHAVRSANKSQQRRAEGIRKRVRLDEVVSLFINLQASGGRLVGHCPFHSDSARAFSVYPETNTYRCSGCGAEGEVVQFLMDKESMTFGQALEHLERFEITGEIYGTS